jgi:pyruvate dehydrogenase E1 component alpha subunit
MTDGPTVAPLEETPSDAAAALGPEWKGTVVAALRWMTLARTLDARMQGLQRQGRVGFYGAATGQEAVNVAAGLVSGKDDWVFPGLREQLIALVRGHPLPTYAHHLFADDRDPARGRNMPCHPTARDVHYVSMSSVIGTQVSQAVGLAFGLRQKRTAGLVFAFFGDGATSSNDFHAGMNFAGVLRVPVLFVCTNNQWAISIPVARQTAARSLAGKAGAYGLRGLPVDGTDFFAAYAALREARMRILDSAEPEMVEFRLYRMTPHSSSDDPRRYQPDGWAEEAARHDPVARLEAWAAAQGLWTAAVRDEAVARAEAEVRTAVQAAEATAPPALASLTEDVYASPASSPNG